MKEMPGWSENIMEMRTFEELPVAAQNYVRRLEELVGVDVSIISVGYERNAYMILNELF